jgi:hypothetical protein
MSLSFLDWEQPLESIVAYALVRAASALMPTFRAALLCYW